MSTFTFDGTSNLTVTKNDSVIITADPTRFTSVQDSSAGVQLAFGGSTLTITGTTFAQNQLQNVFLQDGRFDYLNSTGTTFGAGTNTLAIVGSAGTYTQTTTPVAASKTAIFGGNSFNDPTDGNDTITFGAAAGGTGTASKGTYLVDGAAGIDTITQSSKAFDSTASVSVYGGSGDDTVSLNQAGLNAAGAQTFNTGSLFVSGGSGVDAINVQNKGPTTIYGGASASDPTDLGDTITIGGATGSAGDVSGVWNVYGNGGDDTVRMATNSSFDSASSVTVFGGVGNDSVSLVGVQARLAVAGGEGADSISVSNSSTGATTIYGGIGPSDPNDQGDTIYLNKTIGNVNTGVAGGGVWNVFGNGGDDTIISGTDGSAFDSTANVSVYGGTGSDTINLGVNNANGSAGVAGSKIFVAGGEGGDNIRVNSAGDVTIQGGISGTDTADGNDTITIFDTSAANTGKFTILANGGSDTINVNVSATASTSSVTANGGDGSDTFNVVAQNNNAAGTAAPAGTVTLTGATGADIYNITKGTGTNITITDLSKADNDVIRLSGTGIAAGTQVTALGTKYATVEQALAAATQTANTATTVSLNSGDTYLVINNGTPGFSAIADQAIKLTGGISAADAATQVTIIS